MQLIEHFELQGKLSNTNLTLELGRFQSNLSSSSGGFEFLIGGIIYDETKPSQPLLASFTQIIKLPILKIWDKTITIQANELNLQFKKDCTEEDKNLILKYLELYIIHKAISF